MIMKVTSVAALMLFATVGSSMGQATDRAAYIPNNWGRTLVDAFFTDPQGGTLRPREELVANWEKLPPNQQALATKHCSDGTQGLTDNMKRLCDWVAMQ